MFSDKEGKSSNAGFNEKIIELNGGFVQQAMFDYGKVAISFGSKHLIFINAAGQHVEER